MQIISQLQACSRFAYWTLAVVLLLANIDNGHAQEATAEQSILIRNVTLVDPTGQAEDRLVNVLIRKGELEIITEDKIASSEAALVVNADGGFLLGRLVVGEAPNFMILREDPRTNFDVLLDTKTWASFAIHDGKIVKNDLFDTSTHEIAEEPKRSGWLAYTPPPLAVPLNYRDTSKWNRFESKWISGIVTGALALDRMNWVSQSDTNRAQFGDLSSLDGGEIRAFRAGVFGTINFDKPWVYALAGATHAFDKGFEVEEMDSLELFDWRLDIPFFYDTTMSIGKQKEPISMERLMGMVFLPWQERSAAADALLPSRNVGVVWSGNAPQRYSTWAFGVFNPGLDAGQSVDENATQFVGRLTWAPFRSEDESNLLHLGFGYRYSNMKAGFRFFTEPEFNKSPIFVDTGFGTDTGLRPADDTSTYNLELSWRKGPVWLASEYFRTDVTNPSLYDPSFTGYFVSASWVLTGEMRPYNKNNGLFRPVPVAKTVYQNGKGAWEIGARYSDTDLDDGLVNGGEIQVASLGLNWWLTPAFSFGGNYRYIWNELNGVAGTSSGFDLRLLLMLD
ncbi:MAG: hypothetical protein JSU95_10590 [Betaproteobacteria bacterium]|nr:MAG: hypothetical protein JSU95_10590 [Betaproteobacteria bacterium]